MADAHGPVGTSVAYDQVFHEAPVALLLIRAVDLVMVDANQAYLDAVGLPAEGVLDHHVFEVFPNTPREDGRDQERDLRALMHRAVAERARVNVEELRYDIRAGDTFEQRWWSVTETPILDASGTVTHLLHLTEDVTELVRTRTTLAEMQEARDRASDRVARLSEVALSLRGAESIEDLVSIVVESGLAVLGADGGGLVTRAEDGGWLVSSSEVFDERTQRFVHTPYDTPLAGQTAARTGMGILLRDRDEAIAFHPVMADVYDLTPHTAWAFLPLVVQGRSIGALMAAWLDEQVFDDDTVALMEGFAAQCAIALHRIESMSAERRTAELVRHLAEALQAAMLTRPPDVEGVELAVRYRSASDVAQVGGDWYDSFLQPDGTLVLVIGDVAGHDDVAAGKMSQLRGLLRALAYDADERRRGDSPAAVLLRLEQVAIGLGVSALSSAVLARVHVASPDGRRRLRWSNAGNTPPVLVSPDGAVTTMDDHDLMLGVDDDAEREDHETVLSPGSLLLLYTDGLVERRGTSIERGLADLRSALAELHHLPVEQLCDELLARLDPHLGEDDVALVAARV